MHLIGLFGLAFSNCIFFSQIASFFLKLLLFFLNCFFFSQIASFFLKLLLFFSQIASFFSNCFFFFSDCFFFLSPFDFKTIRKQKKKGRNLWGYWRKSYIGCEKTILHHDTWTTKNEYINERSHVRPTRPQIKLVRLGYFTKQVRSIPSPYQWKKQKHKSWRWYFFFKIFLFFHFCFRLKVPIKIREINKILSSFVAKSIVICFRKSRCFEEET